MKSNKINLNTASNTCIFFPENNQETISFLIKNDEGTEVTPSSEYQFSVSEDANYKDILVTFNTGNGIEIFGNTIFVNISLPRYTESGKKFYEFKDVSLNRTIANGIFNIVEKLIK